MSSTALLDANDLGLAFDRPVNGTATAALTTAPPAIAVPSAATAETPLPARRRTTTKATQRGLFVFDLETIPDYERMDQFDLEPIPEPAVRTTVEGMGVDQPTALLKKTLNDINDALASKAPCEDYLVGLEIAERAAAKPRKGVFDAIAKVRGLDDARVELIAARRKAMSCSPEMCRIVAFGWKMIGDKGSQSMVVGQVSGEPMAAGYGPAITEEEILERFWSIVANASKTIGFNILGFDLPVVFVRSMLLGIAPSRLFDLKPWGSDCVDLMAIRFPKGPPKDRGLKWLAKAMGIPIPAGDVDGSQVEELYKSDPAKVGEYVRSDVDIAEDVFTRYRGFFC